MSARAALGASDDSRVSSEETPASASRVVHEDAQARDRALGGALDGAHVAHQKLELVGLHRGLDREHHLGAGLDPHMGVGRAGRRNVVEEGPALASALTVGSARVTSSPVAGRIAVKVQARRSPSCRTPGGRLARAATRGGRPALVADPRLVLEPPLDALVGMAHGDRGCPLGDPLFEGHLHLCVPFGMEGPHLLAREAETLGPSVMLEGW